MQRTLFPAVPNTAEAQWLGTVHALYAELDRNGGQLPFKLFRGWMRDRNIYVKEEVEALLDFLDCDLKPSTSLRHFGRQFLECETPEAQKVIMFRWLMGWNPLLVKSVFEALDRDAGGRLHSTNELYRMITSYAFAGEHITLPSFQAWIKWMAATEHIRYIGIRWGLGELGKQALSVIKHIDVDEVLEEEEEAREAGIEEVHPLLVGKVQPASAGPAQEAGAVTEASAPAPTATTLPTADVQAPAEADADDDLPDMPPEAPVPPVIDTVDTSASATDTSAAAPIAVAAPAAAVSPQPTRLPRQVPPPVGVTQPGWFPAGPGGAELTAADFGFDARQYGADPALFSYRLACAARLVVSGVPNTACVDLFRYLDSEGVFERYYAKKRSFEEILAGLGWLDQSPHRAAFGWVLLEFMQLRQLLEERPGFPDQLEQKGPADALYAVHGALFLGATDGAAFWYAREMTTLELWER